MMLTVKTTIRLLEALMVSGYVLLSVERPQPQASDNKNKVLVHTSVNKAIAKRGHTIKVTHKKNCPCMYYKNQ